MTERPWSSVTTILANLVGRSVVSAITQTPASGPFGPLTTPPISLSPMVTPAGAVCGAASCADERVSNKAAPIAAPLKCRLAFGLIDALLVWLGVTAPAGDVRSGSRAQELMGRTQASALAHIHAQSIVARNGVGLEDSRRIASLVTHRRERQPFHGSPTDVARRGRPPPSTDHQRRDWRLQQP